MSLLYSSAKDRISYSTDAVSNSSQNSENQYYVLEGTGVLNVDFGNNGTKRTYRRKSPATFSAMKKRVTIGCLREADDSSALVDLSRNDSVSSMSAFWHSRFVVNLFAMTANL